GNVSCRMPLLSTLALTTMRFMLESPSAKNHNAAARRCSILFLRFASCIGTPLKFSPIPLQPSPWIAVEHPLIILPETSLVEVCEVEYRKQGQIVKPLRDGACTSHSPRPVPPAEKVQAFSPTLTYPRERSDIEHRPVEQITVC